MYSRLIEFIDKHNILYKKQFGFQKLEYYGGIRGLTLSLLKSYLTDRTQRVKIGKYTSDPPTVTCVIPQGSVLEPLLFLLYINEIYLSSPIVTFHLFADDTCIFHSHRKISALQTELNIALHNVTNWLRANKVTLNISKSNLLLFNVGNKPQINLRFLLTMNNERKEYAR